jgi:hypothetical protein
MKISQIITERYDSQDPNRPPDIFDELPGGDADTACYQWLDTNDEIHRDGDLPAAIFYDTDETTIIARAWYRHGQLHRETGPAVCDDQDNIQFFLNNEEYSMEEWAEKVDMRKHEMLMMKHKLGLD